MKKRISYIITILFIFVLVITGCGHKSAKTESSSSTMLSDDSYSSSEKKTSEDGFSEKQEESCSSENENSTEELISSETTYTNAESDTFPPSPENPAAIPHSYEPEESYSGNPAQSDPISNTSRTQGNTNTHTNTTNTEKSTTRHTPPAPAITAKPVPTASETRTTSAPTPSEPETTARNPITVTMSISCNVVLHNSELNPNVTVPSDGIMLNPVTVKINEGDTVYDAFKKACQNAGITYEFTGTVSRKSIYISSIAGLSQMDCGPYSGWKYSVNGIEPSVGCSMYNLSDGDVIDWHYTTTL